MMAKMSLAFVYWTFVDIMPNEINLRIYLKSGLIFRKKYFTYTKCAFFSYKNGTFPNLLIARLTYGLN